MEWHNKLNHKRVRDKAWNEFMPPERSDKCNLSSAGSDTRYLKANNAAVEAEQRMVRRQFAGLLICMMKEKMFN